jgi:hypothetical protein
MPLEREQMIETIEQLRQIEHDLRHGRANEALHRTEALINTLTRELDRWYERELRELARGRDDDFDLER